MKIEVHNAGRRFSREWIFRNFNYDFEAGKRYALIGHNGSGKSTLLKSLAGIMSLSEGSIHYADIAEENLYQHLVLVAPYSELIEEFTLQEHLEWYGRLKPLRYSPSEIIERLGFETSQHKAIKFFSSGMKQKLKLALAFYSKADFIFLDEPTSNLDYQNTVWYDNLIRENTANQVVIIIASNLDNEISVCDEKILLQNFK